MALNPPYNLTSVTGQTDADTVSHAGEHNETKRAVDDLMSVNPVGSSDATINNIIALTQAEYDALTPVATTLYVITDA